ncbi:MAG: peptidylprolyl isomerase [Lentisphaeria bacterium]|nr:peptidylprolyl isomerase [Lentisphaeria bacterium]
MMKKSLLAAVFLFCQMASAQGPRPTKDAVIAIINDRVITTFDLIQYTRLQEEMIYNKHLGESGEKGIKSAEQEIVENRRNAGSKLIDQELIYSEFLSLGYTVPKGRIETQLSEDINRFAKGDRGEFVRTLNTRMNMTLKEYREQLVKRVAVDMYIAFAVESRIYISPGEVYDYHKNNPEEFEHVDKVTLRLLAIPADTPLEKRAEIEEELAKENKDFAELVKKYSKGWKANEGGFLGEKAFVKMNKQYRDAVKKLNKGEVAEAFEMDGMINYLFVEDISELRVITLQDAYSKISDYLWDQKRAQLFQGFTEDLRRRSNIRKYF